MVPLIHLLIMYMTIEVANLVYPFTSEEILLSKTGSRDESLKRSSGKGSNLFNKDDRIHQPRKDLIESLHVPFENESSFHGHTLSGFSGECKENKKKTIERDMSEICTCCWLKTDPDKEKTAEEISVPENNLENRYFTGKSDDLENPMALSIIEECSEPSTSVNEEITPKQSTYSYSEFELEKDPPNKEKYYVHNSTEFNIDSTLISEDYGEESTIIWDDSTSKKQINGCKFQEKVSSHKSGKHALRDMILNDQLKKRRKRTDELSQARSMGNMRVQACKHSESNSEFPEETVPISGSRSNNTITAETRSVTINSFLEETINYSLPINDVPESICNPLVSANNGLVGNHSIKSTNGPHRIINYSVTANNEQDEIIKHSVTANNNPDKIINHSVIANNESDKIINHSVTVNKGSDRIINNSVSNNNTSDRFSIQHAEGNVEEVILAQQSTNNASRIKTWNHREHNSYPDNSTHSFERHEAVLLQNIENELYKKEKFIVESRNSPEAQVSNLSRPSPETERMIQKPYETFMNASATSGSESAMYYTPLSGKFLKDHLEDEIIDSDSSSNSPFNPVFLQHQSTKQKINLNSNTPAPVVMDCTKHIPWQNHTGLPTETLKTYVMNEIVDLKHCQVGILVVKAKSFKPFCESEYAYLCLTPTNNGAYITVGPFTKFVDKLQSLVIEKGQFYNLINPNSEDLMFSYTSVMNQ